MGKTAKQRKAYGFLLWCLILSGYFLFVFNWAIMNQLKGDLNSGWISTIGYTPNETGTQAVNYSITAMRGLGSIGAGWVIAKVGHKYAVIIALSLLLFAFPSIFFANIGGKTGFYLLILGRMVMAIGGTVLIIYTQPVIGKFFNANEKAKLSLFNSLGYNSAAAVPLIIFSFPAAGDAILKHWQLFDAIIAGLPIILLITYIFIGKNIEIKKAGEGEFAKEKNLVLLPSTWKSVMKSSDTWKYALFYIAKLTFSVGLVFIITPTFFSMHIDKFGATPIYVRYIPVIFFLAGIIPGIYWVGAFTRTNCDRRYYILVITATSIVTGLLACVAMIYIGSIAPLVVLASLLMFISGALAWGIQGVFLNLPHEIKNNSPQRVSIIVSFTWGIGYLGYTIANVLMSVQKDAMNDSIMTAGWTQLVIWIGISTGMPLSAIIVQKTKPDRFWLWCKQIFRKTEENTKISKAK